MNQKAAMQAVAMVGQRKRREEPESEYQEDDSSDMMRSGSEEEIPHNIESKRDSYYNQPGQVAENQPNRFEQVGETVLETPIDCQKPFVYFGSGEDLKQARQSLFKLKNIIQQIGLDQNEKMMNKDGSSGDENRSSIGQDRNSK